MRNQVDPNANNIYFTEYGFTFVYTIAWIDGFKSSLNLKRAVLHKGLQGSDYKGTSSWEIQLECQLFCCVFFCGNETTVDTGGISPQNNGL